jgi:hypothetical protein
VLSVLSHYVDEERSDALSTPIRLKTVAPSQIGQISDGTKPFEFKISEKGCAKYPITIKWRPTAPMPDSNATPAGLMLETNPNSHIVVTDLPPMVDPPRTSVNGDVEQWRDAVLTIRASPTATGSKGKKRARDEEDDAHTTSPRSPRHARIATKRTELDVQVHPNPDVPAPLRRSMRLQTRNNSSAKGKAKAMEEDNSRAGEPKSRARSRKAAKRG